MNDMELNDGENENDNIDIDENIIEDIEEEKDYNDQTPIDFVSFDKTIKDLKYMYTDGDLILQPDFQRQYVWNDKAATLFIDSLIRGVPIPNIFCSETEDGKWEVIDGQQRLTTVLSFILSEKFGRKDVTFNKLTTINKNFVRLSTSKEFNETIRGKTFDQLTENQQRKIEGTVIRVILLRNLKNNPSIKYDMFMRLNTGASKLNDMELRKCIFRSEYFSKLEELAKNKIFQDLIALNSEKNTKLKRMADVNIVLQFAGLKGDISNYSGSYQRWLNNLLEKEQEKCKKRDFSGVETLEKDFNNAVKGLYIVFSQETIRRFIKKSVLLTENNGKISKSAYEIVEKKIIGEDKKKKKKINIALINALMVGFCKYKPVEIQRKADIIKKAIINIQLNDEEFIKSIGSPQTAEKRKVFTRINKVKELLKNILENDEDKRFFSKEIREKLWKNNKQKNNGMAKCAICGNEIHSINDAGVDHIVPYSKGGETTEENAQLVHSWCNSSKGSR